MSFISRRVMLGGLGSFAALPAVAQGKKPAPPTPLPKPVDEAALPPGTRDMLARIRNAASSGDVQKLLIPIQRNEVPPLFERGAKQSPIATLKARSADGEGKEMLHILLRTLDAGAAALASGAAPTQYLWPHFANTPFAKRNPAEKTASWSLVRVADIGLSTYRNEPLIHRVIIGAEGTWQVFAVL